MTKRSGLKFHEGCSSKLSDTLHDTLLDHPQDQGRVRRNVTQCTSDNGSYLGISLNAGHLHECTRHPLHLWIDIPSAGQIEKRACNTFSHSRVSLSSIEKKKMNTLLN
jgi:hypothetical protein